MKILLLSAYHAQSHASWCSSLLEMFPEYEWTLLTLPSRYFNWRIRGNALTWSVGHLETLNEKYDLVIATSMVDCATLRGLVPNLASIPWRVYFHENQFEYPVDKKHDHTEPKMVSLYNALCAEKIVFNSQYNLTTFTKGAAAFLKKMPDEVPANTIDLIEAKSCVVPVPININSALINAVEPKDKHNKTIPVLLWNHRWEYDKGPAGLLKVMQVLLQRDFNFKLNLIGQQFRTLPDEFEQIKNLLGGRILNYGYIESTQQYQTILQDSDIVLSTALHDFQGLAVLEAVAACCIPVVPSRLAYNEFFPKQYCYQSDSDNADNEAIMMSNKIIELWDDRSNINLNEINISRFSLDKLRAQYSELLLSC